MLWKIIIARDSAEILAALILIVALFFTYRLVKDDKGPIWNFILIAISFLALSAIFSVIGEFSVIKIVSTLEHIFIMVSGIVFASALSFAWIRDKHHKVKK